MRRGDDLGEAEADQAFFLVEVPVRLPTGAPRQRQRARQPPGFGVLLAVFLGQPFGLLIEHRVGQDGRQRHFAVKGGGEGLRAGIAGA